MPHGGDAKMTLAKFNQFGQICPKNGGKLTLSEYAECTRGAGHCVGHRMRPTGGHQQFPARPCGSGKEIRWTTWKNGQS